jgi:hypothetical protein
VVDGPPPKIKHATLLSRCQDQWTTNATFMRSSLAMRSAPSFLKQHALLPPLLFRATLAALEDLGAIYRDWFAEPAAEGNRRVPEVRFAQREADSDTAALAESLSAYCLSQDSDMLILCGRGRGALYAPLQEMAWHFTSPAVKAETPIQAEEDDGFQAVKRKGRKAPASAQPVSGLRVAYSPVPLPGEELQAFKLSTYSSATLALHLSIPPSLLPLLGTLVGNDYFDLSEYFFASTNAADRIRSIAAAIATEWKAYQKRKQPLDSMTGSGYATPSLKSSVSSLRSGYATPVPSSPSRYAPSEASTTITQDPVRYLLVCCIRRLLDQAEKSGISRKPSLTTEEMVGEPLQPHSGSLSDAQCAWTEQAIDSIVAYGKMGHQDPKDEQLRLLFQGQGGLEGISLDSSISAAVLETRRNALQLYVDAYYRGRLSPVLISAMVHRHVIQLKAFLEDPNWRSLQITHCQPLRKWTHAVLFSAYGLNWARTLEDVVAEEDAVVRAQEVQAAEEAFLDEVISVATTDSFSDISDDESYVKSFPELSALREKPDPYVWSEVRRGERLSCEAEQIVPVSQLLQGCKEVPQALQNAVADPLAPVCLLPETARHSIFLFALSAHTDAIRALPKEWQLLAGCLRHMISTSAWDAPERRSSHWLRPLEVQAMAMTALLSRQSIVLPLEGTKELDARHIHLSTMLQFVLEAAGHLSEVLLLTHLFPPLHSLYGGSTFHQLMASPDALAIARSRLDDAALYDSVFYAATDGLEDDLFVGATKAERKERKKKDKVARSEAAPPAKKGASRWDLPEEEA